VRHMGERMKRLGIDKLAIEERLALLDELWDSVASTPSSAPPLTTEQLAELDRRLDALEADGDRGRPFAEFMDELSRSR